MADRFVLRGQYLVNTNGASMHLDHPESGGSAGLRAHPIATPGAGVVSTWIISVDDAILYFPSAAQVELTRFADFDGQFRIVRVV